MTALRIAGIVVFLLELTTFVALVINCGYDSDFFQAFWTALKIISVIVLAGCILIIALMMIIEPEAVINLFTN